MKRKKYRQDRGTINVLGAGSVRIDKLVDWLIDRLNPAKKYDLLLAHLHLRGHKLGHAFSRVNI